MHLNSPTSTDSKKSGGSFQFASLSPHKHKSDLPRRASLFYATSVLSSQVSSFKSHPSSLKSHPSSLNSAPSPYFVGIEAALQRASAKAIAKARAAGLEPVVADNDSEKDLKNEGKSS
jgi:hypothetical protein